MGKQVDMKDSDLLEICSSFKKGILDGRKSNFMCAAVCWPLSAYLSFHGIENEVSECDLGECNHFYIKLSDGRVLDPTAEQFNDFFGVDWLKEKMPDVYLGEPLVIHEGFSNAHGVPVVEVSN